MRLLHLADTFTPIDHLALPARLEEAGFRDITVDMKPGRFRFRAIAAKAFRASETTPQPRFPQTPQPSPRPL
jgi:hypothetical protein